jgi:uncharacterized protein Usg
MEEAQDALQDYRLTTAEILYRMPEYPNLLQSYLWQSLDRVPDFPKLNEFLGFWESKLDGKLHSVRIGYVGIMQPTEWQFADGHLTQH